MSYKRSPPRPPECPLIVDDDERWRATQESDAILRGIFWGKYGKALRPAEEAAEPERERLKVEFRASPRGKV